MAASNSPSIRELALAALARRHGEKWDTTWDSRGTVDKKLSQGQKPDGTVKGESIQTINPTVPLPHALGTGTVGHLRQSGTLLGTVVGQSGAFPYAEALSEFESRCPDYVEAERWRQCVIDAQRFLAAWGDKALALGWTGAELLGLHEPPTKPHPTYSRLSRYDATGLLWLLQGRRVVALTADTAAIECGSGNVIIYRKGAAHCAVEFPGDG